MTGLDPANVSLHVVGQEPSQPGLLIRRALMDAYLPDAEDDDDIKATGREEAVPGRTLSLTDRIHSAWNATDPPEQQWIVEADSDEVIVVDNSSRTYLRVPVLVDNGDIRFGEPVRVRPAYVEDEVAASRLVFASQIESRPDSAVHAGRHPFSETKVKRDGEGQFARKSGAGTGGANRGVTPAEGDAALAAPPLNLADMDRSDPRAEALWFRTGDNSLETRDYPGYVKLNEHMREGGYSARMDGYVEQIDNAMAESKLSQPIRVYRGVESSALGEPGSLEGVEFSDKAFASVSTDPKHARTFGSVMTITVPAGTAAIRMADRDPNMVESEILLDRDLRYRVVKEVFEVRTDRSVRHELEVEVVPAGQVQAAAASKPAKQKPLTAEELLRAKYAWAVGDVVVYGKPKPVKAAADVHTGAMVALLPTAEDAERLAVDGGEPAEELHVTLRYLGAADQIPDRARARLVEAVARCVAPVPAFDADAFSVAAFNPGRADRDPCVTLGISGLLVEVAHDLAAMAVAEVDADQTLDLPNPHKPFHAHLTLGYTGDLTKVTDWSDRVGPIRFDRVRVVFGGDTTDIPLVAADWGALPVAAASTSELPAAEPEPNTTLEDPVSLSDDMRSRLGLDADADETAALAAIDELKTRAEKQPEPTLEMVQASAAATAKAAELETVVDKLTARMEEISGELAAAKADKAATVKASVFDAAVKEGRIKPADREQWETDYDEAPGAITRVLASIAPGTAVPVMASGVAGGPEPVLAGAGTFTDADYNRVFGITEEV
jgi:2'-5' RNA ligase